jgi:multiple sugar transport system permease protein
MLTALAFLAPNALGFLAFTLGPIAASLVLSFFAWPLVSSPTFTGLDNYATLLTRDQAFHQVILNTLYYVFVYVPLNLVVSLGLAVWLSDRVRGANLFRVLFFLPVVTPLVANALVWTLLYQPRDGILDRLLQAVHLPGPNWLGSFAWAMPSIILMSVWAGFGYNLLVFAAGLRAIPRDLYDAAAVDGATRWQQFWRLTLPLLTPSLFFALVLTLISSFQVFTQPYLLTGGGPADVTTTLVLSLFDNAFQFYRMGYASAIAWILFLLVMLVTAVQFLGQRRWVHYDF